MADVNSLIANAQGYAASTIDSAKTAMKEATAAIQSVGFTLTSFSGSALPSPPDTGLDLTLPSLTEVVLELADKPGAVPAFQNIAPLDAGAAPVLTGTAPSLSLPTKPSQVAEFVEVAPAINTNFSFPEPPSQLTAPIGDSPNINDRVAPDAPNVVLPTFEGVRPTDDTEAPKNLEVLFGNSYSGAAPSMIAMVNGYVDAQLTKINPQFSTQMAAIEAQLTKYLAGGTGLNQGVEDAIYTRSRSKQAAEAFRVRDQALNDAASRGFTIPNGALMSAIQQARQSGADNNAAAAREIVVMQAEMEQKNLQFAVSTSTGLRTAMVSATLSYMQNITGINGQAIDYAKSVLNAIVETYNIAAKVFGMKLEGYKTDAQVFESRVRGALATVEVYKAEIQALEALVNIDRAKVEVYKARIESLIAYSNLYRAQIEAVVSRANLEKVKLDLFQAKVQAYSAQVQAKNAEWQGYASAINGETAKVKIYEAEISAYSAKVGGYRAAIEAGSEIVKATALTNQARSEQYRATVAAYGEVTRAYGEVARTKLENQRQQIVAFQAQTQAAVAQFQVKSEYYKASAMVGIENARLSVSTMFQSAENMRKYGESLASLSSSNAKVYAGLAGSAMSGMNSLAAELKYE